MLECRGGDDNESMNGSLTRLAIAVVALLGAASASWSIGLGRATSAAVLGQPLSITLPVRLDAGEALAPECVSAEVLFGDNHQPAPAVQVAVGAGGIRITTSTVVDEPVVTAQVTVGCAAQISRKFTLLADPPVVNLAQAPQAPAVASSPAQDRPAHRRAPVTATVQPAAPSRANPPPRAAAEARAPRAPSSTAARPPRRTERVAAAAPRLQLDPVDADMLADPGLRLDDTLPPPAEGSSEQRAAASALWQALNATPEEMARDREKLQKLEEQFAAVRRDSDATRNSLAALEARLQRAEQERHANPLVFGLAALSALLLLLLVSTWWKRRRELQAAWWNQEAQDIASAMAPQEHDGQEATNSQRLSDPVMTDPTPFTTTASVVLPTAPMPPVQTTMPEPELPAHAVAAEAPRREVSVEELIDLEQQAEFFIVLGQEDAAIDLLMSHVRNTAGTSPLPYLKLLEIYQHRGDRAEYDRIRDRFNNRFNAYAPSWDEDLMHGRTLADYPEVIRRLQSLWATPAHALNVLQASLLRQDEGAGTFDLPAYRELLFLYSIARDLSDAGRATGDVVDLLLPMGDEPDQPGAFTLTTMGPLVAGAQPAHSAEPPAELPSLDLDLDLDVEHSPVIEREPQPEPQRYSGLIEFERLDITQPLPRRDA